MIKQIWTIGHSTRPIDDFIAALQVNEIKLVADVRLLPGSKRYPQFNKDALADSLGKNGIRYEHFPELGGRRKAKAGFTQHRLAERGISRLRRPYGDERVSEWRSIGF